MTQVTTPALSTMFTGTVLLVINYSFKVQKFFTESIWNLCYLVPPEFVEFPDPDSPPEIVAGGSTTITCNATGVPVPQVNILQDGVPFNVPNAERSSGVLNDGLEYSSVSVTLNDLNYTDSAQYSCFATNNLAAVQNSTSEPSQYIVYCESMVY